MRALRFDDQLHLIDDQAVPTVAADEALLRVRLTGICHTDLELTRGYHGFRGILGHEFVGEIVQGNAEWTLGTRVVGEINIGCQHCDMCAAGAPSQCRDRRTLGLTEYGGTFADYVKLPYANLHRVPDEISDTAAVFTEPLAAALQVTDLAPIQPSHRVIVIGAGKLGLLIAQVLKLTGCDLATVVRRDKPRRLLAQWGIPAIDIRKQPMLGLRGTADVVVEATGSEDGFALALETVRPRGTIVLKSTYADMPRADLSKLVVNEVRVIGSRCGSFSAALRLLAHRLVDVESMIEGCYPLDQAPQAFDKAAQSDVLKILMQP